MRTFQEHGDGSSTAQYWNLERGGSQGIEHARSSQRGPEEASTHTKFLAPHWSLARSGRRVSPTFNQLSSIDDPYSAHVWMSVCSCQPQTNQTYFQLAPSKGWNGMERILVGLPASPKHRYCPLIDDESKTAASCCRDERWVQRRRLGERAGEERDWWETRQVTVTGGGDGHAKLHSRPVPRDGRPRPRPLGSLHLRPRPRRHLSLPPPLTRSLHLSLLY